MDAKIVYLSSDVYYRVSQLRQQYWSALEILYKAYEGRAWTREETFRRHEWRMAKEAEVRHLVNLPQVTDEPALSIFVRQNREADGY